MPFITRAQAAAMDADQRLDYLTYTILGEAVGEGYTGMVVVGNVINNRAGDGRFPNDPVAVAGQQDQFTTNAPGTGGNQTYMRQHYPAGSREYQMAQAAARATIIDHTAPDITGRAVNYHTVAMGWPASWPSSVQQYGYIDIGNHRVYPTHPVPPGSLDGQIAALVYDPNMVGTQLSVRQTAPKPATLSSKLNLQRNLNRVATNKANAVQNIRAARIGAFNDNAPFDIGASARAQRPSNSIRLDQPKATGTVTKTGRVIAFERPSPAQMGDTLVSRPVKPPVVASAPWNARQNVAAAIAATDTQWGRGQLVMEGNPNASGAVVKWLYPDVTGQGEANQEGKGPRNKPIGVSQIDRTGQRALPVSQSVIERGASRQPPGQSAIERDPPRVVVTKGQAKVIPQSQIERPTVVEMSMKRAQEANDPATAVGLASSIAAKQQTKRAADVQLLREANQNAAQGGVAPTKSLVSPGKTSGAKTTAPPPVAAPPPIRPSTIPGPNPVVKKQERIAPQGALEFVAPPAAPRRMLPAIPPAGAKIDPIGAMPDFNELSAFKPDPLNPNAPAPAGTQQRDLARKNAEPDLPRARPNPPSQATVDVPQPATQSPDLRQSRLPLPDGVGVGPATRVVHSVPVKVAPVPRPVSERPAGVTTQAPTAANSNTRPGIVTTAPAKRTAVAAVSKGAAARPAAPATGTKSAAPSQSSGSSGNSGGSSSSASPHYVSASTGKTLTPREVSSYNTETKSFEKKTVYR